ncbi:ribosomal protein L18e/L15P [Clohesyomyces aquaticus]|uniref:Ribosomal protein L18e/L15P n=1 Tax=Clohesyomyces aquaticus TaxID=1231657 RepID=A0A1Y1ZVX4_9PLEO|nr:ribosomal protein L18e/L15P [Clohesyomyces aquaticus]
MPPRLRALRLAVSFLSVHHASPITPLVAPFLLPVQQRSASILSSLSDTPGAYQKRIRKGRGPSSGKGKTAGRGQKGQHAHGKVPAGFQGGQTPLSITQPPRGKNKHVPFKVEMSPINLDRIQSWIDQGRLNPERPITIRDLTRTRCLHGVKKDGVKLLSRNADQLKTAIKIIVSRASASAIAHVEALGGTVLTRFYTPEAIKRIRARQTHPTISLEADPEFLSRAVRSGQVESIVATRAAMSDTEAAEKIKQVCAEIAAKYKYRLPDATSRKDIEYYRDPAHRGYLSHTVKEGESPSLFFKLPGEAKDRNRQLARRKAVKASAENRLF